MFLLLLPDVHAILDAILVVLIDPVNVSHLADQLHIRSAHRHNDAVSATSCSAAATHYSSTHGGAVTTSIIIIIIIIQHLYSALKSCKGYGGAGGFRLRLPEQVCFEVFL